MARRRRKHDPWIVPDAAKEIDIANTTLYRWIDRGEVETSRSPNGYLLIKNKRVQELKKEVLRKRLMNNGKLRRGPEPKPLADQLPPNSRSRRTGS